MSSEKHWTVERSATLSTLPFELLSQIITHVETARTISKIASSCKRLHIFAQQDGYRAFVQKRFPYIQPPLVHSSSFWRDAAHGLTTLSRNWERKALLAWSIHPGPEIGQDARMQRTYFRAGQTMGFVPVIDSYESWYGGDWSSRKEVVVWGAGAGLVMRVKTMGRKAEQLWDPTKNRHPESFSPHKHHFTWAKYHQGGTIEGRDDITSINVLSQKGAEDAEQIVVGRASGLLSLVQVCPLQKSNETLVSFVTKGRPVRSATVNPNGRLLAACLSDNDIAVYPISSCTAEVSAASEDSASDSKKSGRTWCSRFLSDNKLAIGHGAAKNPISVYEVGRAQPLNKDVRSVGLSDGDSGTDNRLEAPADLYADATSVYSLVSLPPNSVTGGRGEVFLSGAYDGYVRYV